MPKAVFHLITGGLSEVQPIIPPVGEPDKETAPMVQKEHFSLAHRLGDTALRPFEAVFNWIDERRNRVIHDDF